VDDVREVVLRRDAAESETLVSAIVGPDGILERPGLAHGHRELLAAAPCSPVDLGRLLARWTSSCCLPPDTALPVLLDGRYGSLRGAPGVTETVCAWFLDQLPRLRRAGLTLTMDLRHGDAKVILHADGLGSTVLAGGCGCGCGAPADAARAISRLATQRRADEGPASERVDAVVRAAHARLCEEHLVRSIRTVFPASARTCEAVRSLHHHRDALERAIATSVLWLTRLVIVSDAPEPTAEQVAWFRDACNVPWPDEQIIGLWRAFPELATRINGATLSSYLVQQAANRPGAALARLDHVVSSGGTEATAAIIAEAAAWARLRRSDGRTGV
jgi:hypothetical protein